jgi:hypothetical protein
MSKNGWKRLGAPGTLPAAILVLALVASCASGGSAGMGVLEGTVTVGPRCPVEPCPSPEPPDWYTSREIVVTQYGREVVRQHLDTAGRYRLELPAGHFEARIQPGGISAAGEARDATVYEGEATRLDFAIDTGIRAVKVKGVNAKTFEKIRDLVVN